jgi:hypothetical protein
VPVMTDDLEECAARTVSRPMTCGPVLARHLTQTPPAVSVDEMDEAIAEGAKS